MQSNPPNTPAIFVMTEDGWREIRHFFEIMARPRTLRLHWTVFFLKFIDSSDIRFSSVSSTGSSQGNLGALVPDFIDDSGMLRQAIPHARGGDDQAVAFAGEEQLQIAPLSSRPLIVVQPHGLGAGSRGDGGGRAGDARRPGRADQSRKFTAAVAVALEVSSGSGDAKADQIKGSGAKRVSGEASTSRLQVIDVDCGRTHGLAVIQEEGKPAVVRGWGGNDSGQLGLGGFKPASPIMSSDLPLLGGLKVSRVFCGWDFSMAVLGDGRVMCWGANEAGQLGLGLSGIRWKEQERGSPHARAGMIVPGSCLAISGGFREEDLVVGWECGGKVKKVEELLEAIDSSPLGLMDLIEEDLGRERDAREGRASALKGKMGEVKVELDRLVAAGVSLDEAHSKARGELLNRRNATIGKLERGEEAVVRAVQADEDVVREQNRQEAEAARHATVGEGELVRNAAYHRAAKVYAGAYRRILKGDIGLGRTHGAYFDVIVTVVCAKIPPGQECCGGYTFCRVALGMGGEGGTKAAHMTKAVKFGEGDKGGGECRWDEKFEFVSGVSVDDDVRFPQIREPFFSPLVAVVNFWKGNKEEREAGELGRAAIDWAELDEMRHAGEEVVIEKELRFAGEAIVDEKSGENATVVLKVAISEKVQREAESATAGPSIQRNRRRSVISSGDEREEVFRVSELSLLIMSAEHLPKKDWLFGKCDPYCKVVVDGSKEERKTSTKRSTYAPVWNETITVPWPLPVGDLTLEVMDWDRFSKDDLVGRAKVSREDVMSLVSKAEAEGAASSSLNADLRLEREGRGEIKGKDGKYATLSVEIRAKGKMVDVRKGVSKQVQIEGRGEEGGGGLKEAIDIGVNIVGVYNLPKMDVMGSCDPYVVLRYGGAEDQTSHAQPGYDVEYNEGFELLASHPGMDLDVLVFDYDWATADDLVGKAKVSESQVSQLSKDGSKIRLAVKILDDQGKIVKGHKGGECEVILQLWRIGLQSKAAAIARTQSADRTFEDGKLEHYKVDILEVRPHSEPFSCPPASGSMRPHVAFFDTQSSLSIIDTSIRSDRELHCDGSDPNTIEAKTGKGEAGILALGVYEIRVGGQRVRVGTSKIELNPTVQDGSESIGSCKVEWVPCGGEGDDETLVDILVRVFYSVDKDMDGLREMGLKHFKMKGTVENARSRMADDVERAWQLCDLEMKDGFKEWMRTSRLVKMVARGQKGYACLADLEREEHERLEAAVQECIAKHNAAKLAYSRSDWAGRQPWQVDRDCRERIKDLEDISNGRVQEWEEETEAAGASAMREYRRFLEAMSEACRVRKIKVDNALSLVLSEAEAAGSRLVEEGERLAQKREQSMTEAMRAEYARRKGAWDADKQKFESAYDAARGTREAGIKEAEEAWEKNSERLELEQEAALRGLNKAAKEADLRAKLASLDAQIAKESISPAFLKTLVHPPRSGGDLSPPRLQDYVETRVPLDLAPAKNQPSPIHLWGLGLASGGGGGVVELACGADHAVAILEDGSVWSWGGNDRGQLGRGDRRSWCIPKQVDLAVFGRGKGVHGVSCGNAYTMCLCDGEVWGWGRNDRGQLGHNQGREIGAWLRSKSLEGGISGGWAQGMKDGGVDLWSKLEGLTRKDVAEIGRGAGCTESEWDLVFDLIRGIGDEFKGQNKKSQGSETRWIYSAADHLAPSRVAQGVFVARDGRVYENSGLLSPIADCTCETHSGIPVKGTPPCKAHGVPLGWAHDMSKLHVFPPACRGQERVPFANEGDAVRVGVYPQDHGLLEGGSATMQAGMRNEQDGPQHGSAWVEQQVYSLQDLISDPLTTTTASVHFDGAIHFPFFHPGRKGVSSIRCGNEYTIAVLENGELRFLGDVDAALKQLENKQEQATRSHRSRGTPTVRMEIPKAAEESTAMHLGVLGDNAKAAAVYSPPALKENMLIRAVRGGQRPRGLIRLSLSQLQRLSFPHHL